MYKRQVLYNLLESIRFLGVLLTPFLPKTAEEIFRQLGTGHTDMESLSDFGALDAGQPVGEASPLFSRLDMKQTMEAIEAGLERQKAEAKKQEKPAPEGVAQIGIDDFSKVELRAAKILFCEKVKRSEKLLRMMLDDGHGERQVVSGIAKLLSLIHI